MKTKYLRRYKPNTIANTEMSFKEIETGAVAKNTLL
jgi:hypothetical protein